MPLQGATAPTRDTQGVASLALGWVLHWAFSPHLPNPELEYIILCTHAKTTARTHTANVIMKSRAIVLHITKYNDEQLIADLLTENQGNLGMIVRISRSKRAAVRHTLFQPLAILDLEWEHRPKANLQRPKAVQVAWPLCSLPTAPYKLSIAMFVAEVLHHAIKQEPDSHTIFNYVLRSVQWLDVCQSGFANFHLVFLLRLTHFLGFMPNVEDAREGDYFDLRASCFTAQQPSHADFLAPRDAALVPKLMRMRYDTMRFFHFNGAERSRLLEYINLYYRLHVPNFPELKSLAVLKDLFAH